MSNLKFEIRECRRSDLEDVLRVERTCYGDADALNYIALMQYFDLFSDAFGVAESSSRVIGFSIGGITTSSNLKLGWLLNVAILPDFQGNKVGPVICRYVIDRLKKGGVTLIRATVSPYNTRSFNMLQNLAFSIIDDIPSYFGIGQRRFLMELNCKNLSP